MVDRATFITSNEVVLARLAEIDSIADASKKVEVLVELAAQLLPSSSEVLAQALDAASAIQDESYRSSALAAIAPKLPETEPQLLAQALDAASAIQDESCRSSALAAIAPQLPQTERFNVLEQALSTAKNIQNEYNRSSALAAIAPQLPQTEPKLLEQALSVAKNIQDESSRSSALAAIAPQLPQTEPKLLEQALSAAKNIQDELYRSSALEAIAPQLPQTEPKLLEQVLSVAKDIQSAQFRSSVLVAIAPQLPQTEPKLLEQALSAAKDIQDESSRYRVLAAIAPHLPQTECLKVLEQALSAAKDIQSESSRYEALAAIFPHLPQTERLKVLEQALSAAKNIQYEDYRFRALAAIAPHLPQIERLKVLEQALSTAKDIQSEEYRSTALAAIAPQLPQTPKLLEQALSVASTIQNESSRSKVLAAIAPQLPQTYLPQLLKTTLGLSKENAAEVLQSPAILFTEALAVQLPSDKHSVALEIIKAPPQDDDKTRFLSAMAPRLSLGLLPNALRQIQDAFTQDAARAEALSNLVPYLPTDQLPEALKLITQSIEASHHQTTALENLIPFLSLQGFQDVLNLLEDCSKAQSEDKPLTEVQTKVITEPKLKARILRSVATALSAASIDSELSQPLSSEESEEFLTPQLQKQVEISLLIDKIYNLTIQLKIHQQQDFSYEKEAANILSQVAPAFAHLSDQNREYIPEFVSQFKDLGYQAQVLRVCVSYFPKVTNQFLEECGGDDYRALLNITVRAALLNQLHTQARNEIDAQKRKDILKERDKTLNQIHTTLTKVEGQYRKAEALVEVARHPAGSGYQTEALQTIRGLSNTYLKDQYLQRLIPGLLDNERLETANIIREISDSHYKVKAFVALACKFPEFRTEAKTTAQALENRVQRIEQLSTLAVEVPEILPDIIDIAEEAEEPIERKGILVALVPHLPMRINRERLAGRPITNDLWDRALYLLARGYRDALQGGSLRNESAQDKDFLNLQDEVNALADLLLMRDLEPPMTVGILGGWGGGKSYIMHLMQTHMTEVRSRPVAEAEAWNPDPNYEKLSPYVGHIYQIKFDAWTFAKSDLWASLMQTIFFELDRQLTLETQITAILNGILDLGKRRDLESKIWAVLYQTSDTDRQWFLERVLTDKALLNQLSGQNQGETTGQLWKTLHNTQQEAIEQLKKTQQQLEIARRELDTKKATIRTQINDQFAPLLKINDLKQEQGFKRVDALLGTSFILLRQRIGSRLFKHLHNKIHQELYGEESNSSKSGKRVGLWQELSQTLEQLEQARKELALAATGLQPSQPSIGNFTTSPSNVASLSNTESSAETSVEQSRDEAAEQPKPTQEEVQQKIDTLFQKAEGLKLDIQTVAASVIEQQYWRVNWVSGWQWVKKNWLVLLLFLGFFISPLLLWKFFQINPIEIGTATVEQILTRIAAILAPTLPTLVTLQSLLRSSHKWFEETQLALHEYEKSVENRNKQLEDTIETTIQKRLQEDSELQQLERNVRQLETQVEQQQNALPVNEYASLNDFVNDRLSSKTYANRLGLMQQVKEDLFDLSNKLLPPSGQSLESKINFLQDTFPRGPARVVVYIDDLDRCPPDRVVQVLEAVQLLVKTPLFIAVLAVDERYITRALEKFYEGVLSRRGRPSGTEYLEKIIQLPYRVRPIMANTLESYLRSQVVIQDSATGGAKFSEFSRQEFNMLLACCQQVDLSPRTLKRLTNVYKLFKIVCRTRGTKPSPQAQQAILALLALSGRYPSLMRGIFDSIETCFEEHRTPEKVEQRIAEKAEKTLRTLHLRSPMRDFFKHYQLPEGDRYLQREFEKLKHDALQTEILPRTLTLEDMTHEIFNLIRSFSFVGEIGEDPEDYLIIGPTAYDQSKGATRVLASEVV